MLTYSRWDPSSGHYDYFETQVRPGLNDDMPVPKMPKSTELGVPSVECGRPMPKGATHTGSGEIPIGFITPPAGVDRLAGDPVPNARTWMVVGTTLFLGAAGGYLLGRWRA